MKRSIEIAATVAKHALLLIGLALMLLSLGLLVIPILGVIAFWTGAVLIALSNRASTRRIETPADQMSREESTEAAVKAIVMYNRRIYRTSEA